VGEIDWELRVIKVNESENIEEGEKSEKVAQYVPTREVWEGGASAWRQFRPSRREQ
jgi:hypothetical protein